MPPTTVATTEPAPSTTDVARVPGGTFLIGAKDFYPEERPVHRVTVDAFWLDRAPVTVAEFRRFLVNDSHFILSDLSTTRWTAR
jgi:sulfatase modifying factor 1